MKKFICIILVFGIWAGFFCTPHTKSESSAATSIAAEPPVKQAKNIILMIGDGMGLSQITSGLIAKRDALNLERIRVIGLSKTFSGDNLITDSAAGATAFSTGVKTYNGAIGVGMDTLPRTNIVEIAERNGIGTGLVATASITHATPAAFFAHQPSRLMDEEIAADFLKSDIDVFIAGGKKFFEIRKDGRNLLDELKEKKYTVASGMESITKVHKGKLAGFTAEEHLPKMSEGRGEILTASALKAIELLSKNKKGFFLMIEGSQIDWGGHAKDSQYIINEMVDFDNTIGKVLDFAEKDGETLVIITADHETGGYSINGGSLEKGIVNAAFTTDYHTGVMVPVFAFGPGAEVYAGIYHINTLFNKMLNGFGIMAE